MNNLNLILKLAKTAGYLKRIKRTGWVRKGIKDAESVADHVFRTAFLCMILTREMNINYKKLIDMTLIHDLGETATSDIRYEEGKKIIASEKAKNQIEEDVFKMFFSGVEDGKYYLGLWYEFRDQTSKEAKLLKKALTKETRELSSYLESATETLSEVSGCAVFCSMASTE